MRLAFVDGARKILGPLTPYQKPLVLMLLMVVPIVACITLSFVVFNYMFVSNQVRENEHGATTVRYETIETAVTAHDLSLKLVDAVSDFDDAAEGFFGQRHAWTKGGERFTPEYIDDFVHAEGDLDLLNDYFELSTQRLALDEQIASLQAEIDQTIATLPVDASRERVLQAQRLTRVKVDRLARELSRLRHDLEQFGIKFRNYRREQ